MDEIAIVSLACRMPGAETPEELWNNLVNGICCVTDVPKERWDADAVYGEDMPGKSYCKKGGFLSNPFAFDRELFDMNEEDAAATDPQQRIALELAYETFEAAGYNKQTINGQKIGVFLGVSESSYKEYAYKSISYHNLDSFAFYNTLPEEEKLAFQTQWKEHFGYLKHYTNTMVGIIDNMVASRISHEFNIKGPSLSLDTACSSSLVAIHLACESIRRGECTMALAGGTYTMLSPSAHITFSATSALSKSDVYRVFDKDSDGFMLGEGAGLVLLKPLKKAIEDHDTILGIVKDSAINNDGTSIGIMAPNTNGQKIIAEEIYDRGKVKASDIQLLEAHGTGTKIGDSSEIRAISNAFKKYGLEDGSIYLTSIKPNIGHLISASGVASFIKMVLALQNKTLPKIANLRTQNPKLNLHKTPFKLAEESEEWKVPEGKLRTGAINSYGFGGTNCHMVLQEWPQNPEEKEGLGEFPLKSLLTLSAHTKEALKERVNQFKTYIEANEDVSLYDLCCTSNRHLFAHEYRCHFLAENREALLHSLGGLKDTDILQVVKNKIVFMFTGQGSQYLNMLKTLYDTNAVFHKHLEEVSAAFFEHLQLQITDLLFSNQYPDAFLAQTNITQPVMFAIDYSIAKFMMDLGVKPNCLMGHSVGEWVAAAVAESITLDEAARIITLRGRLLSEAKTPGAMAAVFTNIENVENLLEYCENLWFAAYNGSHQVVSGTEEAVTEFLNKAAEKNIVARKLRVSQAFHSPLMQDVAEEFKRAVEQVEFKKPLIPIVSNVTASFIEEPFDSAYWCEHILMPVQFEQSIRFLQERGYNIYLECGPDATLSSMARNVIPDSKVEILSMASRKLENSVTVPNALGRLYARGIDIPWQSIYTQPYEKCKLPVYPFQRTEFKIQKKFTYEPKAPDQWFYRWEWSINENAPNSKRDTPVLLCSNSDLAHKLGEHYTSADRKVTCLNLEDPAQLQEILMHEKDAVDVLYIWDLPRGGEEGSIDNTGDLYAKIHTLYNLGKMLKTHKAKVNLNVLTVEGQKVLEQDCIHPFSNVAAILSTAMALDSKNIATKVVDLCSNETMDVIALLYKELNEEPKAEEELVAIRNGQRYVRSMKQASFGDQNIEFQEEDTILITGGAGNLGAELAKSIGKKAKCNLVLTGRKQLPPRENWGDPTIEEKSRQIIDLLMELENLGATPIYKAVDVTQLDPMKELIDEINRDRGAITGVIHCAGAVDSTTFNLFDRDFPTIERVLSTKIDGTLVLDQVTQNQPLKFFAMISSISASKIKYSGSLGDYAAANGFLNSFSEYRKNKNAKGVTLALNYSLIEGGGMGGQFAETASAVVKAQNMRLLNLQKAVHGFFRAFSIHEATVHIADFIEQAPAQEKDVVQKLTQAATPSKNLNASDIKNIVLEEVCALLSISKDHLEEKTNFIELGLDSLGAVKLIERLGQRLQIEIFPTLIFEYQTPKDLVEYLVHTYSNEEESKSMEVNVEDNLKEDPMAIIGISLRVPSINNLEEYWEVLSEGKVLIDKIPEDRLLHKYCKDHNHGKDYTSYSDQGGFIHNIYAFDPGFFGISPKEAESMDPQQRLFLEVAFEALQQAGYAKVDKNNKVGVFVGCEQNGYMEHFLNYRNFRIIEENMVSHPQLSHVSLQDKKRLLSVIEGILEPFRMSSDAIAGNGMNEVASRVNHCLDLKGPSLIVNTACSSSLVALHLACESLRNGSSDMALVGGVNLNTSSTPYLGLSKVNAISPTGVCRPFDKDADGMILSEGVSAILIKPLSKALEDNDYIHAVIKGSAINNDGHSQGITAPRPQGQAQAIIDAYNNAKVNPETVGYIETHGTGTPLGDPIEVEGMQRAFSHFTNKKDFCAISSVKSSIGHMLAASGLVSLIKVVLSLKHKQIPPIVNYSESNKNIHFKNTAFYPVHKECVKWERKEDLPLRAGVNGFGFGGTNAHIVLEEAPDTGDMQAVDIFPTLLHMNGKKKNIIHKIARSLRSSMEQKDAAVSALCYTFNRSQKSLNYKVSALIESKEDLLQVLKDIEMENNNPNVYEGKCNPNKSVSLSLFIGDDFIGLDRVMAAKNTVPMLDSLMGAMEGHISIERFTAPGLKQFMFHVMFHKAVVELLQTLEVKIDKIHAEGKGAIVAQVLAGKTSFSSAISELYGDALEIKDLQNPLDVEIQKMNLSKDEVVFSLLPSIEENTIDLFSNASNENHNKELLRFLAQIYVLGIDMDLSQLYPNKIQKVPIPTYPFENATYKASKGETENILSQGGSNLKYLKDLILEEEEKEKTYKKILSDFNFS